MTRLCSMPYEDHGELTDCWDERRVKARKRHTCYECSQPIEPGMVYGRAKGLVDHQWSEWRRCPACLILAEWVATVTGQCPLWGGLGESVDYANEAGDHVTYDEGLDEFVGQIPGPREHRRQWEAAPNLL